MLGDMLEWPFYRMQTDMLEMVLAKADATLARYYAERLTDDEQQHIVDGLCNRLAGLTDDLLRTTGSAQPAGQRPGAGGIAVRA
ncbi:phosphoenolpyruvate carboxylase [Fodinibius sp.]|uniref:phosphoenolpyruvate carboxylase n=1 Tax=Fodinibius sp. TaxID=1872440 RepID=UPI003A103A89